MEECRPLDLVIPVLGAGTGNISGKVITQEQFAPSMEECRPLELVIPVLGAGTGNISGKHNKLLSVETLNTSELAQNEENTKMFILCVNHILLWEWKWCHCISYHDLIAEKYSREGKRKPLKWCSLCRDALWRYGGGTHACLLLSLV